MGGTVFSPDGQLIVGLGYVDLPAAVSVVRLWKSNTGREVGEFEFAERNKQHSLMDSLAVSPDGKLLLLGTSNGHVVLCRFPSPPASDRRAEEQP
jgi:hypothetical protein